MKIIAKLYLIEGTLRKSGADFAARVAMRERHSARLIKLLRRAVDHLLTRPILPKSDLGIALRYALGQLPAMETYLHDGAGRDRQQPARERDSPQRGRQEELAFRRQRRSRGACRGDLQLADQRPRSRREFPKRIYAT